MELHEALGRITEIRAQLARTETYRGFRSLTVGLTGWLAFVGAWVQWHRVSLPAEHVTEYVALWVGVAVLSFSIVALEVAYQCAVARSPLKRHMTMLATQQFAPCLVAGALVTAVIAPGAAGSAWMLPGLWAIVFSLGIFSTCRLLPRPTFWVGVHYMASGAIALAIGNGTAALSPWLMVGTFGCGQLLTAAILYYSLERGQ